jgi:hypothetical protein
VDSLDELVDGHVTELGKSSCAFAVNLQPTPDELGSSTGLAELEVHGIFPTVIVQTPGKTKPLASFPSDGLRESSDVG